MRKPTTKTGAGKDIKAGKARDGAPPEKDITAGPAIDVSPGGVAMPPVALLRSGNATEGEWRIVKSSNIRRVRWERALSVEFHSGKIYTYTGVPHEVWDAMMKAPSQGSFLTTGIVPKYPVRKDNG